MDPEIILDYWSELSVITEVHKRGRQAESESGKMGPWKQKVTMIQRRDHESGMQAAPRR